jgi:hypothetical protein
MLKMTLLIISIFAADAAQADMLVKMNCQKSLSDGRILVANAHALPTGSKFKIVGFQATESANGWSTGPCLLDVTPKPSR